MNLTNKQIGNFLLALSTTLVLNLWNVLACLIGFAILLAITTLYEMREKDVKISIWIDNLITMYFGLGTTLALNILSPLLPFWAQAVFVFYVVGASLAWYFRGKVMELWGGNESNLPLWYCLFSWVCALPYIIGYSNTKLMKWFNQLDA